MLGRRLLNELAAISESFVLVLDDYHHIDQPAVHELVGRLLRYPPPSLHLVILTRRDPNLALSSLRARHRLLEIRPEDLRFDRRQTAAFMENALGLSLSGPALARLHSSTEGWPVSLRLAAVALRHGRDAEGLIRGLGGDSGQIREYLVEEILASQPAEIRESLYKVSILERFCAPLCESVCGPHRVEGVTPDCAPAFDGLLQGAGLLTVPLDADREWCRFHHLFQELLERQLERRTSAAERAALHRRASAWLARSGLIEEALRHALAGGDVDAAVRLVDERSDETMNRQQWHRLEGWLELFPAEVVEATPALLLLKALSCIYRYRWAEAWKILDQAEPLVAATPPGAATGRRLRGIFAAVRCHRCYFASDAERAVACGERALALLPPEAEDVRAFATNFLALSLQMRDDLDRACRLLYDTLEEQPGHRGTLSPRVFTTLGLVHWVDGDLGNLEQVASNLLKLGEELDLRESREWAGYFLGMVHYQRGELEAAQGHLTTAVEKRFLARTVVFLHGTTVLALCRLAQRQQVLVTSAVPLVLIPFTMPLWARLFDRGNVLCFQAWNSAAFALALLAFGSAAVAGRPEWLWIGAVLLGIAYAGGSVGWHLGTHHFAPRGRTLQYMGLHVSLSGVRGLLAPLACPPTATSRPPPRGSTPSLATASGSRTPSARGSKSVAGDSSPGGDSRKLW